MKTWWLSWKQDKNPVKVGPCGSVYVDFEGQPLAEIVYICDEPMEHPGLHIDKVERKAWANPDLRLRSTGYWMTGQALPPMESDTTSDERTSGTWKP